MSRVRRFQLIAGIGTLLVLALMSAFFTSDSLEAQRRFREFTPPKNPVVPSVDHRFEFPGNVQAETRRNQRGRGTPYSGYVKVFDEHESVSLMIPVQWNDVELDHAISGDHSSGIKITASSDLIAYQEGKASGVTLIAVPTATGSDAGLTMLEEFSDATRGACGKSRFSRQVYEDPFFSGQYDFYSNCMNGASQIVLGAIPGTNDATVLIQAVILNEADLEAIATVFDSFQILGTPGVDEHHEHDDDHEH